VGLRARLVLAFVLLAVVPLTAVTLYSYRASERAFRAAVEAEAGGLAEDMRSRMDSVTARLGERLENLGDTALAGEMAADERLDRAQTALLERHVEQAMRDVTGMIESLEIVPEPPAPAPAPEPAPDAGSNVPPAPPPPGAPGARSLPGVPSAADISALVREQVSAAQREAWAATQRARDEYEQQARAERDRARADRDRRLAASRARVILRKEFAFPVRRHGRQVAVVHPNLETGRLLSDILEPGGHRAGEIPFAIDAAGNLHASPADLARLQGLALTGAANAAGESRRTLADWVVVTRRDPASGLTLGVARPIGEPLKEIRRTAMRNLGLGLAAVALGLVGIVPMSRRITRELGVLTDGAERLARGDLDARVPVRSGDEVGRLSDAFNRMAHELRQNQDRLLAQERLRKELEMGRRIQEEMLPRDPLRVGFAEVKGVSIPAREVGGDFFNYFTLPGGEAALLVGDVSGKGVAAALLMANVQATLRARLPLERDLTALAARLDDEIADTVGGGLYLTLFLSVLDPTGAMRYVNAGHNMPFVLHADGRTEALESTGRPLGLLAGGGYQERRVALEAAACLFLYTDGVIESENAAGEPFGLERLRTLLVRERTSGLDGILSRVEEAVRAYRDGAEAADDATMVVLRVGRPPGVPAGPDGASRL
jgi:serine phosphatase RsbU (regulator of sigma subunit)